MTAITYIAKRNIMAGHSATLIYTFTVAMERITPDTKAERDPHIAKDGTTETVLTRIDKYWTFQTVYRSEDQMKQVREFLDSVMGGESFTINVYGDGIEDNDIVVTLESKDYQDIRVGTGYLYKTEFQVRKLPV